MRLRPSAATARSAGGSLVECSATSLCSFCRRAAASGAFFYVFLQNSTTISLLLRYLDLSVGAYKVLDLQCPHGTPAPVTGAPSPRPPSTPDLSPPVVPNPKVFCSSHQMAVELPAGAISGIYVKGLCVNMLGVHVQRHIWLPSSLHRLNLKTVVRGHAGIRRVGVGAI